MTTEHEHKGRRYTIVVTKHNAENREVSYVLDIKEGGRSTIIYHGVVSSKIIERLSQRAKQSIEDCLCTVAKDILGEWFP